ncbi:GyrI-like domain-containing protein [Vibrio lentus]|nr:GyrI-like domain-containing protein [Vibrio lentus]
MEQVLRFQMIMLQFIGVVDLTQSCFDGTNIHYWAGVESSRWNFHPAITKHYFDKLKVLTIPKQTYAVAYCGPIENLRHTLSWFVLNWLPSSGYRGVDGC